MREVILEMKFMGKEIRNLYKKIGIQISYMKFKTKFQRLLRITVKKKIRSGVGRFPKILRNLKSGWGEKGQKYAYVIFEWSPT